MDLNEIKMYSSHDPFETDDENVYDYSFEDICSSFDALEIQFVDGDTEQTIKNLFRYRLKRSIPMGLDSCKQLAKEYTEALENDIETEGADPEGGRRARKTAGPAAQGKARWAGQGGARKRARAREGERGAREGERVWEGVGCEEGQDQRRGGRGAGTAGQSEVRQTRRRRAKRTGKGMAV